MAKVLTPNQIVNGYTIERELNKGEKAISYAARTAAGEKVFFKQYKSPTPTVPWFQAYVDYQAEVKRMEELNTIVARLTELIPEVMKAPRRRRKSSKTDEEEAEVV